MIAVPASPIPGATNRDELASRTKSDLEPNDDGESWATTRLPNGLSLALSVLDGEGIRTEIGSYQVLRLRRSKNDVEQGLPKRSPLGKPSLSGL